MPSVPIIYYSKLYIYNIPHHPRKLQGAKQLLNKIIWRESTHRTFLLYIYIYIYYCISNHEVARQPPAFSEPDAILSQDLCVYRQKVTHAMQTLSTRHRSKKYIYTSHVSKVKKIYYRGTKKNKNTDKQKLFLSKLTVSYSIFRSDLNCFLIA